MIWCCLSVSVRSLRTERVRQVWSQFSWLSLATIYKHKSNIHIQSYIMSLSPSTYLYTFIMSPDFLPSRWVGRTPHRSMSNEVSDRALWFCWSRCCHIRLTDPPPRQHSRNMCCSVFSVYTFVFGISLFVFLTLSLSLPQFPSLSCLSLYLNILFSMCMCLSVVWECVFDSDKKRASVQVPRELLVSTCRVSLSLSLSLSFSVSLSSLSEIRVVHWTLCRQSTCNLVCVCHLISKSDEKMSSDFEIRFRNQMKSDENVLNIFLESPNKTLSVLWSSCVLFPLRSILDQYGSYYLFLFSKSWGRWIDLEKSFPLSVSRK